MSFMSQLVSGALAEVRTFARDSVTYCRGEHSVVLTATVGKSQIDAPDKNGVVTILNARDFMFAAAALILDGEVVLPESGDRVLQTIGTTDYLYSVLKMPGQNSYDFSDSGKTQIRVHTLLKSATPHV